RCLEAQVLVPAPTRTRRPRRSPRACRAARMDSWQSDQIGDLRGSRAHSERLAQTKAAKNVRRESPTAALIAAIVDVPDRVSGTRPGRRQYLTSRRAYVPTPSTRE